MVRERLDRERRLKPSPPYLKLDDKITLDVDS